MPLEASSLQPNAYALYGATDNALPAAEGVRNVRFDTPYSFNVEERLRRLEETSNLAMSLAATLLTCLAFPRLALSCCLTLSIL